MSRRVGIVVAWFAATIVAIGVAATAVGSVRGQVTDVPVIPVADTVALLVTTTTAAPVETSTTITLPTTTTTATEGTAPPTTSPTPTTTTPQSTTTTTAPAASIATTTVTGPAVTTYQLIGGQVTISALRPSVTLVGAVPAAGFSAEVDDSGPEEVEIDFESSGHKSSFRARWEGGRLDVDIDEESEHDD